MPSSAATAWTSLIGEKFSTLPHPQQSYRLASAMRFLLVVFFLVFGLVLDSESAERVVDLELVLAADASGSVNDDEYRLQLIGIARAFRDPVVRKAIRSGPAKSIAVNLLVWAEPQVPKDRSEERRVGKGGYIGDWSSDVCSSDLESAERVVDLELVLAADASGSVNDDEYRLQLIGIARAFRDPVVRKAIRSGPAKSIAVNLLVWAEPQVPKD